MPVYRSGSNTAMLQFRAAPSGLKPSRYFALPFHPCSHPEASAAPPVMQLLVEVPSITKSFPLTFHSIAPCLLLVAISWAKTKASWQSCFFLWGLHGGEVFFIYLIVTFLKVLVFQEFPGSGSALVQPGSRECSSEDWNGLAVGHKIWAGSYRSECLLTGNH